MLRKAQARGASRGLSTVGVSRTEALRPIGRPALTACARFADLGRRGRSTFLQWCPAVTHAR
eukprot:5693965-Lingulodinium_polyedra.AAC.1